MTSTRLLAWRAALLSLSSLLLVPPALVWGSADLCLYLDLDELAEPLEMGNDGFYLRDRSTYRHEPWMYLMDFAFCAGAHRARVVDGVGRKALEVPAPVSAGAVLHWTALSAPKDSISVLMWLRLGADRVTWTQVWDINELRARSQQLLMLIGDPLLPLWRMGGAIGGFKTDANAPNGFVLLPAGDPRPASFEFVGQPIAPDRWVHHAATFDARTGVARLYTDGELVGEAHTEDRMATDWRWREQDDIAGGFAWDAHYDCGGASPGLAVDDINVWKRALTREEIEYVAANGPLALAVSATGRLATAWGALKAH